MPPRPPTHTPGPCHPLTSRRPLPSLVPSRLIPLTSLGPTSRKRTDQPTAASRRLFRGAEHAPPRKEKRRDICICGARNRKMAANLFWVGEGRTLYELNVVRPRGGYGSVCVEFLCRAKKGGVYRRGRIIGDSLFLLASPSHVPFQFTRPIYRLCSIDYPKLRSIFLRSVHPSFEPVCLALDRWNLRQSIEAERFRFGDFLNFNNDNVSVSRR